MMKVDNVFIFLQKSLVVLEIMLTFVTETESSELTGSIRSIKGI